MAFWMGASITGGLLSAGLALVHAQQRRLIYPRFRVRSTPRPWIPDEDPRIERLWLRTWRGKHVEAWLILGDGVSAQAPGPAVLFAHGNAEVIDEWPELLIPYRRLGVSVLLAELRGYGRSDGQPSQRRIIHDFTAWHELLSARPEVDARRIAFHGRSLGGGVVCALARVRRPCALILQSTFRSAAQMANHFMLPSWFVRDPFDNEAALRELRAPTLIFHGRDDRLVPCEHAEALARVAHAAELITFACAHNDIPPCADADPEQLAYYWDAVETFLRGRANMLPPVSARVPLAEL